ncbi:MAG TPA: hypothetical protein PLR99_02150 [Polyangiaceae bacterium]|jgi:hypothetical protein|nr:hypothetical protein [Polyangiaceae bacterium]
MTTATFDQLGPRDMRDLREDTRGAVMVMGLFMATFLIGAMWFMKGIGDAVVFKDRMQEAADHVAFTSAVVHARGMNIISVINIVMYVIALIWVILCMLKDLLDLAVTLLTTCAATIVGCAFCCEALPVATAADRAVTVAKNAYEASAVNIGLPALSLTGTAVAIGYPWYGTYAGYSVGSDYKSTGVAIGPSNIPGMNFSMNLDKYFGGGKPPSVPAAGGAGAGGAGGAGGGAAKPTTFSMKLGLPVTLAANSELCLRFTGSIKQFFPGFLGTIVSWVGSRFVEARGYCNGGVWTNKNLGWKKWYGPAKNGNDWLQIWSILTPEKYDEGFAESKVALAIGSKGAVYSQAVAARGSVPQAPIYSAEAEFYYDCDQKFSDAKCNGDTSTEVTFNMRWMARLRHVRSPSLGALLGGALTNLFTGPVLDFLGGKVGGAIKGSGAYKAIEGAVGSGGPFLGAVVSDTIKKGTKAASSAINGAIDAPVGAPIPQILH